MAQRPAKRRIKNPLLIRVRKVPKYKRVRVDGKLVNARDADGNSVVVKEVYRGYRYYEDVDGTVMRTPELEAESEFVLESVLRKWVDVSREAEEGIRSALKIAEGLSEERRTQIQDAARGLRARARKPYHDLKLRGLSKQLLDLAEQFKRVAAMEQVAGEYRELDELEGKLLSELDAARQRIPTRVGQAVALWLATRKADEDAHVPTLTYYRQLMSDYVLVPVERGARAIGDYTFDELASDTHQILRGLERALRRLRVGYAGFDPLEGNNFEPYYLTGDVPVLIEANRRSMKSGYKVLDTLSQALAWAVTDKASPWFQQVHPMLNYQRLHPRTRKQKRLALRGDAYRALVAAAETRGWGQMIPLFALVRHGFRPGEARALRWSDRIGSTNKWRVVGSIIRDSGERWVERTKTTIGEDEAELVTLSESTVQVLEKHRVEGCDYVVAPFPGARKLFLTLTAYTSRFATLRAEAQLEASEEKTLYMLKHGLVSELIRAGFDLDRIVLMTRHTSREMVLRIYNDIDSGDLAVEIDKLP